MKFYDRENERQVLGEVLQQSRREAKMTVLMGVNKGAFNFPCCSVDS